jgi:hypothetical protein
MPKKSINLSELLIDIDKDQLCDILLNLAENSPEVDNRIRTLITPKSKLNNPVNHYKKLLKGLPTKVKNASDRKLLLEGIKPILTQIKDLQNTKNYLEASKPLFVILEIMVFKLAKSELKSMLGEMQKATIAWCENVVKINNSEQQFTALQEVLSLESSKELKLEPRIIGYGMGDSGFVPTYSGTGLHVDYYQLVLQLSKSLDSINLLEDLRGFLSKHKQSKAFELQLLYISQKVDSEEVFVKKVGNNLRQRESAILLKDYFWNKGEHAKAVDILFQHIELNKGYFQYKSSDEYLSAQEYIEIFDKNPEYCRVEDCVKVLVSLITTGDSYTAQDVGVNAKWRPYLQSLIKIDPKNFQTNYFEITEILAKKHLSKTLAAIAIVLEDKKVLSSYLNYIEGWDGMIEACQIIAADYPDIALKKIANISRSYLSEYSYAYYGDDFKTVITPDRFLKVLETIKANIGIESHKQIDNLVIKVHRCYNVFKN